MRNTSEAQRARRGYLENMPANVAKHTWWYEECSKHGRQVHMSVIGGCVACKKEKEEQCPGDR